MKIKQIVFLFGLIMFAPTINAQFRPVSDNDPGQRWHLIPEISDEFDGKKLNTNKWQTDLNDFGNWSWENQAVVVDDDKLKITMRYDEHQRNFTDLCKKPRITEPRTLYFKSGIAKSRATALFGYYEAKIRGANIAPRWLSPAFWLYSNIDPVHNNPIGTVLYSEIDVVELQQGLSPVKPGFCPPRFENFTEPNTVSDHNLHAMVVSNVDACGNPYKNPSTGLPENRRLFKRPAPFPEELENRYNGFTCANDPSKNFNVYAVENRPDSIFWYVNGQKIAEKPNSYHKTKAMNITLSMGLRSQFSNFKCGKFYPKKPLADADFNALSSQNKREFFPESNKNNFPLTFETEYIRSWQAIPSLWFDQKDIASISNTTYASGEQMEVFINYHPGSGFFVDKEVILNVIQKNKNNDNVTVYKGIGNIMALNKYGGRIKFTFNLINNGAKATPTADLPIGHKYIITGLFGSSKNAGTDVFITQEITNITIK